MKIKLWLGALLVACVGASMATPAFAQENSQNIIDARDLNNATSEVIAQEIQDDVVSIKLGKNLLLTGNNVSGDNKLKGILFSAGNQVVLKTQSAYALVAGNTVEFTGVVEKDLFIAANLLNLKPDAQLERDVFATASKISVETSIDGAFNATAGQVTFSNVEIMGDVNLNVDKVIFNGIVKIDGKFSINEDAEIINMSDNVTYRELEKYENFNKVSVGEYLIGKLIGCLSLIVAIFVFMAMFARINDQAICELNVSQFGKDLGLGLCVLLGLPLLIVFLIITYIGAPLGLVFLAIYLVMLYLAQAFSGLWLGKLILSSCLHLTLNSYVEAAAGIALLCLLSIIPGIGWFIWLLSTILGLGIILQCFKPHHKIPIRPSGGITTSDGTGKKKSKRSKKPEILVIENEVMEKPASTTTKSENNTPATGTEQAPATMEVIEEVKPNDEE